MATPNKPTLEDMELAAGDRLGHLLDSDDEEALAREKVDQSPPTPPVGHCYGTPWCICPKCRARRRALAPSAHGEPTGKGALR